MRSPAKFLLMSLVLIAAWPTSVAAVHSVPKGRGALNAPPDWFPYVFSKMAPLEWWSFAASPADVRREDYPSEYLYDQATRDTVFPRFCFSLFRPKPKLLPALSLCVRGYRGGVTGSWDKREWNAGDECIYAWPPLGGERIAPPAGPDFVQRAIADIPRLCS